MEIWEKAEQLAKTIGDKFAELMGVDDPAERYLVQSVQTGDALSLIFQNYKHHGRELSDSEKDSYRERFDRSKWPCVLQAEIGNARDSVIMDDFEYSMDLLKKAMRESGIDLAGRPIARVTGNVLATGKEWKGELGLPIFAKVWIGLREQDLQEKPGEPEKPGSPDPEPDRKSVV